MKQTALVTGVGKDKTGYAIAERFAKEGYDVVVTSTKTAELEYAEKTLGEKYGVKVYGCLLDLRSKTDAVDIFADLDAKGVFVSAVCLNAADLALGEDPSKGTPFFEVTPEYVEYILQANVVGNFRIVREAVLRMKEKGKGAIVFISSNTVEHPNPNRVPYVTSKGGINAMSRSLAVDLGKYGIRSNVVMPGTIKTTRWVAMGDKQITNGTMTPIGDISDFEDIANAAYFLGSDQAKNITGTEIMLDGGMTTQLFPEILVKYRAADVAGKIDWE